MPLIDPYNISESVKDEVIKYVRGVMRGINPDFFKNNKIRVNLFLEVLYDVSLQNLAHYGNYKVNEKNLRDVYAYARSTEMMIDKFIDNEVELLSVDDADNDMLIFKVIKYINTSNNG